MPTDEVITMQVKDNSIPVELVELVKRCFVEKPAKDDLRELEKWADRAPEMVERFFQLGTVTQAELIKKIGGRPAQQTALTAHVITMREGLGYNRAPLLERLLIDSIVNSYLRLQWTEYQLSGFMGSSNVSFAEIQHWEKRLTLAQARHLRAVEALAKVRKMALPVLQVNIAQDGGQQVNVAGDLVRESAKP